MGSSDMDRKLQEAAARSPALAAMLTEGHRDPSARTRRLAVFVGGAAVAIGLIWLAAAAFGGARVAAPERPREPAEEIDNSHYLAPIKTAAGVHGEETAPFSGFAISVETEPAGGLVTIAGVPRGEAPVLANVACKPGAKLEIQAEMAGFPRARRQTACRADTLVKLTIRLGN
jgi:hypothetical protein